MKTNSRILVILVLLLSAPIIHAQIFTTITTADGLPSDNVTSVVVDQNNLKWFGTQEGVARYNDTSWTVYTTASGLIDNYINCITVDASNHIWIGTDLGVSTYDGSQWISYTPASGMLNDIVNCIAAAPNGNIWIGTPSGASKFDGTAWTNYTTDGGLPANMISSIAVESNGNVWLGTYLGGLSKFDGSTFKNFTTADSLPSDNIITIGFGAGNSKWIGTYSGVAVFDNNDQWTKTYRKAQGLFNDFVQDIDMDSKGIMWFGLFDIYTQDPGVSWINSSGSKSYAISDGLLSGVLRKIAIDKGDVVWIATNAGVSRLRDASAGISPVSDFPARIYPNPASSEFHMDGMTQSGLLSVSNVTGCEVLKATISKGSNVIPVNGLESGIYILRFTTSAEIYTGKLIIR
jgi:ligand-binding sensor domain-containing protein